MNQKYFLLDINSVIIPINKPSLIFLRGGVWLWKTTLSKHIINDLLWDKSTVISPTYTYYNSYTGIVHFDLYRIKDYDEFFAIGWEDILDNNTWVVIVEWPEKIEKYYTPDIDITLKETENEGERELEIVYKTICPLLIPGLGTSS